MRPHLLRVQAFGAFAEAEQVCFDDLEGLFLLHGETGAGKTTLLDAIAFALYGRVPGERGNAKRLRSDHAAPGLSTEVRLEATIGGRRLLVTRKPEQERAKRSGTGTVREPASVRLEERGPDGEWEVKSTRVGEADAEIALLMGMSAEQFFQVVLLPQGQFAQFLHARAQDKEALLEKLFGTDRFRRVEEWLARRRNETRRDVESAAEAVDRLMAQVAQAAGVAPPDSVPPVPDPSAPWQATWAAGLASAATSEQHAAAAQVSDRQGELDAALAAKSQAEQLADRQRRRLDALRRKAELEAYAPEIARLRAEADAASRAAEVAAVLDAADRAASTAERARRDEEQARAAIPEPPREAAPEALRAAATGQQHRSGRLEALRAVAEQAAAEDDSAAAALTRAGRLDTALAEAEAEAGRHRDARPEAVRAREEASQAAADVSAAQEAARTSRRVAADSAALLAERAKRDQLREAHLAARENAQDLREEAGRVRQARVDGMSAELAATLFDGSPCPVCGSLDHPDPKEPTFETVSREREDAAAALADEAAQAASRAGEEVAAADAVIAGLTQRLAGDGFAAAGRPDVMALAAAVRQAEDDARLLGAAAASLQAAADGLAGAQRAVDELDESIARDKARLVELTEQRGAALAEAEAAAARAAGHRADLRAQLGGAPDLDTALSAARALALALTGAADAADAAARAEAQASEAREHAASAAAAAGFGTQAAAGPEAAGQDPVAAARAAFRDARWRAATVAAISDHEAEAKTVTTLLAGPDLDVELDPPAPVAETAGAAAAARQAHAAAVDAHGRASHTAQQLALLEPRVEDALAALGPLLARAEEVRQLAELAEGRGANQYKMTLSSFVLAARLEEVAQAASERLITMTAGRYTLVHTDARRRGGGKSGLGLLACDSWTGVDRDTSTLSGGETFLASLALALGLADVVTAEAAGTPMEALFVDEGFGTLDEDTLDEVMNVLDGLREGGRIVGIVSHVTELRQRIPAQVHVRKGHHGSRVAVTAG